jgi:thiamine pyrophosphate-dependent acetolactate synthase large subunit-like protein
MGAALFLAIGVKQAPPTDAVRSAQAFGGHGVRIQCSHELSLALKEAAERPSFTLIGCTIDAEDYVGRI